MKKIILNEWTFFISVLTTIFLCFLSTGFRDDDFGSVVINFFGSMLLVSLVITALYLKEVSKNIKRVVIGFTILMLIISMSSCRSTRSGCPDTWGKIGYK